MGVDAQGFAGGLLRLDPAFAYVEPPSHDLCHGPSASLWLPTPICKTAKETQMYITVFWTLWERERGG